MKRFLIILCLIVIVSSVSAQNNGAKSVAMLNYLATETRLVVNSTNSRLVLEETYNKLINNTNPAAIDQDTRIFLETLLDNIEKFRMLSVQRERLEYIFENQKSQAISQSLPNPLYLLGSRDLNPLSLIATLAVMTVDSIFKFQGAVNNAEMEYLKSGWELDDKEAESLHTLRREALFYMRDITVNNKLKMEDTLNEVSIDNFVKYSLDENLQRSRQWLESSRSLYSNYAPFWLLLAETYYESGLYRECLEAVARYETVQAQVLRKEHDFAKILPKAIIAVSHVHGTSQTAISLTQSYLQKLIMHTTDSDWGLRYFAAQSYIRLAGFNNRQANLSAAYNLLVDNVVYLSRVQENLLAKYMAPINETIPKGTTKEKEKQMQNVIKGLKNQRKNEQPPMHEGLLLNYQTLLGVMKELNTSTNERNRIKSIIDKSINNFILRNSYFSEEYSLEGISLTTEWFLGTELSFVLPVLYVNENMKYLPIIYNENGDRYKTYNWRISSKNVDRKRPNDIKSYSITLNMWASNMPSIKKNEMYSVCLLLISGDGFTAFVFEKAATSNVFRLKVIENIENNDASFSAFFEKHGLEEYE